MTTTRRHHHLGLRALRARHEAEDAICALCRAEYQGRGAPGCPGTCRLGVFTRGPVPWR